MRKNPHAVALGRKGGRKGGRARMEAMTPSQRRAFARKGGKARQAALRSEKRLAAEQEHLNKIHDGRWMMERLSPLKRLVVATEQSRAHYRFLRELRLPSYPERMLLEWARQRSAL